MGKSTDRWSNKPFGQISTNLIPTVKAQVISLKLAFTRRSIARKFASGELVINRWAGLGRRRPRGLAGSVVVLLILRPARPPLSDVVPPECAVSLASPLFAPCALAHPAPQEAAQDHRCLQSSVFVPKPVFLTSLSTVVAADGLSKREAFRLPDPFAVITVDAEQTNASSVIRETLNPYWNESFDM
jgi:hypothetical protein